MALLRFGFCLLLITCYVLAITAYKIDHHSLEDRNERAVTEWRFRRNYLLSIPHFHPGYANERSANNEANENDNDNTGETSDKKYFPHLLYDRMNK